MTLFKNVQRFLVSNDPEPMNRITQKPARSSLAILAALLLSLDQTAQAKVTDDFDDNKCKGWEKFDFGTGNVYFIEKVGQFIIGMHKPTG